MSFLNKITGVSHKGGKVSRRDSTAKGMTFDDAYARTGVPDVPDLPLPSASGTVTLDMTAMPQGANADSSIITEAAPSEMADFTETRIQGAETAGAGASGLPFIGNMAPWCCLAWWAWWR